MGLQGVNIPIHVTPSTTDARYLSCVEEALDSAIASFRPSLIFYNAGTDILEGDPLNGGVTISSEGIAKRDQLVFKKALDAKVPVAMVLSGGYAPRNASVVGASLVSLIKSLDLIARC